MNLNKAITLLKTLSDFPYILPEKKPHFSVFERPDDEYVLVGKTELIHEEYRNYVKKIAESHTLIIEESNGLMVIYDPWGKYFAKRNLF